jgi:hypothetical protein
MEPRLTKPWISAYVRWGVVGILLTAWAPTLCYTTDDSRWWAVLAGAVSLGYLVPLYGILLGTLVLLTMRNVGKPHLRILITWLFATGIVVGETQLRLTALAFTPAYVVWYLVVIGAWLIIAHRTTRTVQDPPK